jgi:O-antigen/teichoic acid export membrane protein
LLGREALGFANPLGERKRDNGSNLQSEIFHTNRRPTLRTGIIGIVGSLTAGGVCTWTFMATFETSKSIFSPGIALLPTKSAWKQVHAYAPTFLTEFVVMASQILLFKLASHYFGKTGFSEYALARRTFSLLFPLPLLGMAVGLPRYIGVTNGRGDRNGASRYYKATMWCVAGTALSCGMLVNLFSKPFAYIFFGDSAYRYLAFPLSLMILGQCLHTVICGYFRGHMMLNRANALQIINLAIVPIICFIAFEQSLVRVLDAIGLFTTLVAAVGIVLTSGWAVVENNWKETKELFWYGIQRVPGDFILVALFTLPATFVAHLKGIQEAGFVAFGISVVSIIGAVFAPVGLVLLPKATLMLAEGSRPELRHHLRMMLRITIGLSVIIVTLISIWMPNLIQLYLGAGYGQVVPIARVLILGALPYSVYLVLRNIVDAYHKFGVTAAILSCGFATFLGGSYFARTSIFGINVILGAFVVALVVIAILSNLECTRILQKAS